MLAIIKFSLFYISANKYKEEKCVYYVEELFKCCDKFRERSPIICGGVKRKETVAQPDGQSHTG